MPVMDDTQTQTESQTSIFQITINGFDFYFQDFSGRDIDSLLIDYDENNGVITEVAKGCKQISEVEYAEIEQNYSPLYSVHINHDENELVIISGDKIETTELDNAILQAQSEKNISRPEKLLPFLNANYEKHQARIDTLSEKKSVREDKISRNEEKINKLNEKAERLQTTNDMLKAAFGENPIISAFINRNEEKIDKINNQSIPNRENKIRKHKSAVSKLNHKISVSMCKSDKAAAISGIIKSFVISDPAERRISFSENLDKLHNASKKALNFKLEKCEARLAKLNEQYVSTDSALEKQELSKSIAKLNERKHDLSEKIKKLTDITVSFTKQPDTVIDSMIENTKAQLDNAVKAEDISSISENICIENGEYIKNAEIELEDDLNMIDGIIDNGAKENKEAVNREAEKKDDSLKTNPEYYNQLKKEERYIKVFPVELAEKVIDNLKAANIAFSSVVRNENKAAVTVNKKDIPALKKCIEAAVPDKPKEKSNVINPDYYKSLTKAYRIITPEPKAVANNIMKSLSEKNIPYSAVERDKGVIAITVSKNNIDVFKDCEKSAKAENQRQFINPEVYKEIPKEERQTMRMSQEKAEAVIDKLEKENVKHSAILNGEKSAVTVQRGTFSMKQLKQESENIKSSKPKENIDKTKKQEQAI